MNCQQPIWLPSRHDFVACRKCIPCLARARRDWSNRVEVEWQHSENAYFVTMTYDEMNVPRCDTGQPTLEPKHISQFLKDIRNASRIRKGSGLREVRSPRFYLCGEYGTKTERPHYHVIFFNLPDKVRNRLREIWGKGFVSVSALNRKRVRYATKYTLTRNMVDCKTTDRVKPFRRTTTSTGGIGKQWLTRENIEYALTHLDGRMKTANGFQPMPSYYKERLGMTAQQKEAMKNNIQEKVEQQYEKDFALLKKYGYENPGLELEVRQDHKIKSIFKQLTKTSYEYETV